MTANQLSYQSNLIRQEANELESIKNAIEREKLAETVRSNLAREAEAHRSNVAQEDLRNRENWAKYGALDYPSSNEDANAYASGPTGFWRVGQTLWDNTFGKLGDLFSFKMKV